MRRSKSRWRRRLQSGVGGGSSFAWSNTTKTSVPSSYNVSEKYFINAVTYTSGSNFGDGKAKITLIKLNGITDIKINRGNIPIDFNYEVHDYYLNVDNDMTNVRFNIATEEGYTVNQTNKIVDMTNILSFTNTITVTREEEKKNEPVLDLDAILSKLNVGDYTLSPAFNKDKFSYSITVQSNVDNLTVQAIASSSKAKVIISGNSNLKPGINYITITVTAEDGCVRIYTLNVKRSPLKSNNDLSDMYKLMVKN